MGSLVLIGFLLNVDGFFDGEDFDVASGAQVGINSAVSSVSSPSALLGSVNLDVGDSQITSVKSLNVGIGLEVLQETDDDLNGLLGPSALSESEFLSLAGTSDVASVASEGDAALVSEDVLEVGLGELDGHSLDGLGGLISILVMDSEVGGGGLGSFLGDCGFSGVLFGHFY